MAPPGGRHTFLLSRDRVIFAFVIHQRAPLVSNSQTVPTHSQKIHDGQSVIIGAVCHHTLNPAALVTTGRTGLYLGQLRQEEKEVLFGGDQRVDKMSSLLTPCLEDWGELDKEFEQLEVRDAHRFG